MKCIVLTAVALLLVSGCSRRESERHRPVDAGAREKAIAVAREYVERQHPDWRSNLPWAVWREGDKVYVAERLPEDTIGGGAVIVLDGKTFQVVHAYHLQ